jgi:hypothetical protein
MRQQYFAKGVGDSPVITIDGFSGQVTINGVSFTGAVLETKGSNTDTNVLLLSSIFGSQEGIVPLSDSTSTGQISFIQNWTTASSKSQQYTNQGTVDPNWLYSMLAPLRQEQLADRSLPVPSDVTDLALIRVGLESVSDGFTIVP